MSDTPQPSEPAPPAPHEPQPPHVPGTGPVSPPPAHAPPKSVHQVVFVAHPKLLYVWPLILAGFLFWWPGTPPKPTAAVPATDQAITSTAAVAGQPTTAAAPAAPVSRRLEYLGWAYIWIALLVVLALGIDLGRTESAVLVLVVALVWVLGILLRDRGFTLFGDIYRWFADLNVQYDRGLGLSLSILLLIPYVLMLIWARLNNRWRITHNEFEHYSFGRSSDSLGRGAKTIRTEYPDFFEAILGLGAGTLIVYNASGTRELRRIANVPLLPWLRRKLDLILERTAVTAGQIEDEEDDQQ